MNKRLIDIVVFAHNERENIPFCITDLARQEFDPECDIDIKILCNGCTDDTYEIAVKAIKAQASRICMFAENIQEPGKSRTWNLAVSRLRPECEFVVFIDGDIRMKDARSVQRLLDHLRDETLAAVVSRPVPVFGSATPRWLRVVYDRTKRPIVNAICGQLYAVRASSIRDLRLPVPCLVEDGFLAACLVTGLFSQTVAPVIRVAADVSHEFLERSTLREFFDHSVRVELGTLMNAALFTPLWKAASQEERLRLCAEFAEGRGVDEAFSKFLQQPENRKFLISISGQFADNALKEIRKDPLNAPYHVAKQAYVVAAKVRAHRLLEQRTFRW